MPTAKFIASVRANLAYWRNHEGLADPLAWSALDRERENLYRAVEFGLRQEETWAAAAELALTCFSYAYERGYWSEWALLLELAVTGCPEGGLAVKGKLLNQLGSHYRKVRLLNEAQAAHEQAVEIGRAIEDPHLTANAQRKLGEVNLRRLQYDDAERYARLALAGFEEAGRPPAEVAHTRNLLGIIALRRGDYDDSAKYFYQAIELLRLAQEPIELGHTMVNLCQTLTRLGRVAEALELFEEAALIFTKYDLQLERSRLHVSLGFLHYSQDELAQAEAAFRQAYTLAIRRAGPVYHRSLVEMNLGNVLLSQGQTEESRSYFSSAVTGFRLVKAQTFLANSLDGLAETSLAAGDRQEAIALYEEALEIVQAIPDDAFAKRMEERFRGLLEELNAPVEEEE